MPDGGTEGKGREGGLHGGMSCSDVARYDCAFGGAAMTPWPFFFLVFCVCVLVLRIFPLLGGLMLVSLVGTIISHVFSLEVKTTVFWMVVTGLGVVLIGGIYFTYFYKGPE